MGNNVGYKPSSKWYPSIYSSPATTTPPRRLDFTFFCFAPVQALGTRLDPVSGEKFDGSPNTRDAAFWPGVWIVSTIAAACTSVDTNLSHAAHTQRTLLYLFRCPPARGAYLFRGWGTGLGRQFEACSLPRKRQRKLPPARKRGGVLSVGLRRHRRMVRSHVRCYYLYFEDNTGTHAEGTITSSSSSKKI